MPLEDFDALLVSTAQNVPMPPIAHICATIMLPLCVWSSLNKFKMLLLHICNGLTRQRYVLLHGLVFLHFPLLLLIFLLLCRQLRGDGCLLSCNFCQCHGFHWKIGHSADSITVGAMFVARTHFSVMAKWNDWRSI